MDRTSRSHITKQPKLRSQSLMMLGTTEIPQLKPLSDSELHKMNAYWRAANYLSVGQIYLMDNPLLREPLRAEHVKPRLLGPWGPTPGPHLAHAHPRRREPRRAEHVKPRLLGHWGTTPGLNFVYAHLNRAIRARDLRVLYVTGPGHGGPGPVAHASLE